MTARPISAVAARAASKEFMRLLFDEAEDVFEHDDGVVDHDADHQDQREHRDAVQGKAERPHHAESRDDRSRNGYGAITVERQLRMKAKHHQARQDAAQNQVHVDFVQRGVDVARLVADDFDFHIGGELPSDAREVLL